MLDDYEPHTASPIVFLPSSQRLKDAAAERAEREAAGRHVPEPIVTIAPAVPGGDMDLETFRRNATNATRRAHAAFAMRKRMIPFEEIAEFLGYPSAAHAKAAVVGFLADTVDPKNDTETLRQTLIGTLEDQVRRAAAFASADYFEDENGNRVPNDQRIAWHKELRQDVEVLARISGAQAAAQIQLINPESAELDEIVRRLQRAEGRVADEPDVLVLEATVAEENADDE